MAWPLAGVRPEERRNTLGAFVILFGTMAGHSLLETARDALFLAKIPASRLPLVYLAIAALALLVSNVQQKDRKHTGRALFAFGLQVAAVVTAAFWLLVERSGDWILYALYVWSGLLSTLLIVRFWIIAGELFTVTQAKRLFAFIGTGSILGAIAGSAFAQRIVTTAEPSELLLGAAGILAVTGFAPLLLVRPEEEASPARDAEPTEVAETFRAIWNHPYVRRIGGLVLVSTVTFTLIDFVFKSGVAAEIPAAQLGWVFATTYLALNILSLVAQLVFVGWVTRNLGVDRMLSLLPGLLLIGSVWIAAGGGLLAAFLAKGFDGTFRHSLHRTATEVLYVPIARARRERVKSFIDVVGQRGGQALASIVFLALAATGVAEPVIGGLLVLLCGAWILLAFGVKRHYFDLFRDTLREGAIRTRIDFPEMDLASLESLMQALSSPDEAEVVAALDLLAEKERVRLVPALILYHPSPRVVVRALQLFQEDERTDHLRLVPRLHDHDDEQVRVQALLATPTAGSELSVFEKALEDDSPDVRATALVGLLSATDDVHPRIRSVVDTTISVGSSEAKRALARAIAHRADPRFDDALMKLADDDDPRVARSVALAMRVAPIPDYVPALVPMLRWRAARTEARGTLVAIGEPALDRLATALPDETIAAEVRRHLPRTISLFDPDRAGRLLLDRLSVEPDGVIRFKILRALGSLRAKHPSVRLEAGKLDQAIEETLGAILRLIDWRATLVREARSRPESSTPVRSLLVELLSHKEDHAIERFFRLLSLRHPREDLKRVHAGISAGNREAKASARELLELVLRSPLKEAVLGVLDDVPDAERLARAARYYRPVRMIDEDVLRALIEQRGVALRCLAGYHIAELALGSLRDELSRACDETSGLLRESFRNALEMLDEPGGERAFVVHQ
jgi:AAA family ATP:ADP antiporter